MSANLTPQYIEAEKAYRAARTSEEKIAALQEMLSVIPKHKATEKIQADLKKRISRLRAESERKGKGTATYNPYIIEREGAGQITLLGMPNVGKSTFVGALSKARVTIAEFPFATTLPLAGMVSHEDVKIQLVDTPPIVPGEIPGDLMTTIMRADRLMIILDMAADNALDQLMEMLELLEEKRVVREDAPEGVKAFKRKDLLILANKMDLPAAADNLAIIKDLNKDLRFLPISAQNGLNMAEMPGLLFKFLNVIRVYSKVPGQEADLDAPFVLSKGSTVLDLAKGVHKEFVDRLEKARVWGSSRFPGQTVARDYVLADKDIVELHV